MCTCRDEDSGSGGVCIMCTCRDEDSGSDGSDEGEGGERRRKRDRGSGMFDEDFLEGEFRKRRKVSVHS